MSTVPEINPNRLWTRLMHLAGITVPDIPWTRRSFSSEFAQGRRWLAQEFKAAGLTVATDTGGNLIGNKQGSSVHNRPIVTGSHSDTVPAGGRFDGILGVLAGIEVAQTLKENDIKLSHPLEVIDFLAEEPSEFGLSCIGSKAMAGLIDKEHLTLMDSSGRTLAQAISEVGGCPDRINEARRAPGSIAAYIELHIEQAKYLEKNDISIGVVTDIAAIRRENIHVIGRADHAGATPMAFRSDALVTASQMVKDTQEMTLAANEKGPAIVATIGLFNVFPNAANAVPGEVEFHLETRCGDDTKLKNHTEMLLGRFRETAHSADQKATFQTISCGTATISSPLVLSAIETAADKSGFSHARLSSGAGHDAVYASKIGPAAMIFIPCRDGRSHTPKEWASKEQCAAGTQTLLRAVLELDNTL
jgi:N-carbamoyl-L-amino-acid hydrolase